MIPTGYIDGDKQATGRFLGGCDFVWRALLVGTCSKGWGTRESFTSYVVHSFSIDNCAISRVSPLTQPFDTSNSTLKQPTLQNQRWLFICKPAKQRSTASRLQKLKICGSQEGAGGQAHPSFHRSYRLRPPQFFPRVFGKPLHFPWAARVKC